MQLTHESKKSTGDVAKRVANCYSSRKQLASFGLWFFLVVPRILESIMSHNPSTSKGSSGAQRDTRKTITESLSMTDVDFLATGLGQLKLQTEYIEDCDKVVSFGGMLIYFG